MMKCTKCQMENPPAASFCQSCGTSLGASTLQAKTIAIANPNIMPAAPAIDAKTIVHRVQQAFGAEPMNFNPGLMTQERQNQREHTVFANDISGSMGSNYDGQYNKLEASIRAAVTMVVNKAMIDPYDEVGIVTFESHAHTIIPLRPLHSHKQYIIKSFQSLIIQGGTDINAGLQEAKGLFDWYHNDVVRRIVLLTDGHGGHPLRTAEELKSKGVIIDVIGVGDNPLNVDEKLLRKVASVIGGESRYRFIKDQQTLVAHYTQLANKTATS